jgi:hypothetical protein
LRFSPKYPEEHRDKRERDRFQVEFNPEERALMNEARIRIMQPKDATAIKQLAFLGYFAISNHDKFMRYFQTVFLGNFRRSKRLGLDTKTEIESKFRLKSLDKGGELPPGGVPSEP